MPPVAAPAWWEDVQQEREDFAGRSRRPVDEWLDEDVDFAPRKRLPRRSADAAVVLELDVDLDPRAAGDAETAEHELPAVFVHAESARGGGVAEPARRSVVARHAQREAAERPAGTLDDQRFLAVPPPDGARRTVHITGRPEQARAPLPARRHRPRTTADRVGPRPDKIALYAVMLGVLLILIAISSASPS